MGMVQCLIKRAEVEGFCRLHSILRLLIRHVVLEGIAFWQRQAEHYALKVEFSVSPVITYVYTDTPACPLPSMHFTSTCLPDAASVCLHGVDLPPSQLWTCPRLRRAHPRTPAHMHSDHT